MRYSRKTTLLPHPRNTNAIASSAAIVSVWMALPSKISKNQTFSADRLDKEFPSNYDVTEGRDRFADDVM